jgi:uncharacterized protein (TIGR04141 family)
MDFCDFWRSDMSSIQTAIYLINNDHFEEGKSSNDIITEIVQNYNENLDNWHERYEIQPVNPQFELGDLQVRVYYSSKQREPKWKDFLRPVLDDSAKLHRGRNREISHVTFVFNDQYIFAISGGQGTFLIQDYIDSNFGLDLLARIISNNSQVIKSLTDRGMTGSVLGSQRFFRFDYRLVDDQEFGKLYKEIKAAIGPNILVNKFGFSAEEIKKDVGCIAKSAFKINKSISLRFMISLIRKISDTYNERANFELNSLHYISNRGAQNKVFIERLDGALFKTIVDDITNGTNDSDIELCHPQYEKYLMASSYRLFKNFSRQPIENRTYDERIELDTIVELVKAMIVSGEIQTNEVEGFLKKLRVTSYDSDCNVLTDAFLGKHLNGEITIENEHYIFVDGGWYRTKDAFLNSIDQECSDLLERTLDNAFLTEVWNTANQPTENDYNKLYFLKENHMVFDKITIGNIEICDVMRFDDDTLSLIHVKKGFDNSIRDLTSQIYIAARLVQQSIFSKDYTHFEALYDKQTIRAEYVQLVREKVNRPTKEQFVEKISARSDKVEFCLAFLDKTPNRDIRNLSTYDSSIAKFSIIELNKKLLLLGFSLKIVQIRG